MLYYKTIVEENIKGNVNIYKKFQGNYKSCN
jgi:hypothetical protein